MMRDTRFALLGVREGIGQPDARVTSSPVANPAGGESVNRGSGTLAAGRERPLCGPVAG